MDKWCVKTTIFLMYPFFHITPIFNEGFLSILESKERLGIIMNSLNHFLNPLLDHFLDHFLVSNLCRF